MNRWLSIMAGPEIVLGLITAAVFYFCARHNSYSDSDVRALEKLLLGLPLVVVPVAFLTYFTAESKSWTWLTRVNIATTICLALCAFRIVNGFGRPGSGPHGQDVGLILVLTFGTAFCAIGNAICGSLVLREQKAVVAEWFRSHPVGGVLVTAVSTAPILAVQIVVTVVIVAVLVLVSSVFERSA